MAKVRLFFLVLWASVVPGVAPSLPKLCRIPEVSREGCGLWRAQVPSARSTSAAQGPKRKGQDCNNKVAYACVCVCVCIYIYIIPPCDGSTFLLFEGDFGDGMQLFYLECPMRLDQHQLSLSKEVLFKI